MSRNATLLFLSFSRADADWRDPFVVMLAPVLKSRLEVGVTSAPLSARNGARNLRTRSDAPAQRRYSAGPTTGLDPGGPWRQGVAVIPIGGPRA